MPCFWIVMLIFCTMSLIKPARHRETGKYPKEVELYYPAPLMSAALCHSAQLQCCILNSKPGKMIWFKQETQKPSEFIAGPFNLDGKDLYTEDPRLQIKKEKECFFLSILNITWSDEAEYYCALVYAEGIHLTVKDTSEPAVCGSPASSESNQHENKSNNIKDKTEPEKTRVLQTEVLVLGTMLGVSIFLIVGLIYFLQKKRKCESCNSKPFIENSAGMKLEYEGGFLNYSSLKLSKQKSNRTHREEGESEECVYSDIK